jgi:hypothetical protein
METSALIDYFNQADISYDVWAEQRRGKVTASLVHKLMKGFNNETAKTYIKTLAGESIGIYDEDNYQSPAMIAGSVNEFTAMQEYSNLPDVGQVIYGSKVFVPLGDNAGVSPDGVELKDFEKIYLEVKCPFTPNKYVELVLCNTVEKLKKDRPDVYWQCVMNMLVLDCSAAKVLVYHPKKGLRTIDVPRIEEDIIECQETINKAVELKLELTEKLIDVLNN